MQNMCQKDVHSGTHIFYRNERLKEDFPAAQTQNHGETIRCFPVIAAEIKNTKHKTAQKGWGSGYTGIPGTGSGDSNS